MTNAPSDLLGLRVSLMAVTGLHGDAIGVVGDGRHQRTGGYHEGKDVLTAIGRYHPGAPAGSASEDYSVRTARDRRGLTESASAMDVGYQWPRGGNAAWLRWNRLLVQALRANDSVLNPIRGINFTPDGTTRQRIDRERRWQVEPSGDTVTIHTHVEFYRDTEGQRQPCLLRLVELARQAIDGTPAPSGGDFMSALTDAQQLELARVAHNADQYGWALTADLDAAPGIITQVGGAPIAVANAAKQRRVALEQRVQVLEGEVAALSQAIAAAGGNPDIAPVLTALQALATQVQALDSKLAAAGHGLTG